MLGIVPGISQDCKRSSVGSPSLCESANNLFPENPDCRAPNLSIFDYFEFLAYAKAGRTSTALQTLKRIWGSLLKQGYTRFMEDIRPQDSPAQQLEMYGVPYGNSLCHAWAGAAAIILLVRGILGIWPKAGGYTECEIRPALGGLSSFKGSVPTPFGPISLDLKQGVGGILSLPPRVRGMMKNCAGPSGAKQLSGPGNFAVTWD